MSKQKGPKKRIPNFKSEAEEREFWVGQDSADYLDWSEAKPIVLANLRPSTSTISLRLPDFMLEELKLLAHQRDVPYQSLLKVFVADRVSEEWRSSKYRGAMTDKVLQPTSGKRSKATVKRVARAVRG